MTQRHPLSTRYSVREQQMFEVLRYELPLALDMIEFRLRRHAKPSEIRQFLELLQQDEVVVRGPKPNDDEDAPTMTVYAIAGDLSQPAPFAPHSKPTSQ